MKRAILVMIGVMASGYVSATNYVITEVCSNCGLQTPVPDPVTRNTLTTWTGEERWFALAQKFIEEGDTVTICNASWCAKYVRGASQTWFDGVATRKVLHLGGGKPCTPHDPPGRFSTGMGGGHGSPGGTVTVGPLLPGHGRRAASEESIMSLMRLCM